MWTWILGFASALLLTANLYCQDRSSVEYVGKTKYLNNVRAVVTHSIDDSTKYVTNALDALDKYGVKTTVFVSTEEDPPPEERFFTQLQIKPLWPRLQRAISEGHEIGSHARTHPCKRPDTEAFCAEAYTDAEVAGSRDDILKHTRQPWVWTWCYPCGHCANHDFIQKKIAAAGYIVARNYPNEAQDGHIMPDLQTWDSTPFNAAYTQVVQKRGGSAKTERLDVQQLNGKFDEIYERGGIYNFMSHPQWLDYGADAFYERHLAHISKRPDVWYVPMGPLNAFRTIRENTDVRHISAGTGKMRFAVSHKLDRKIYSGSVTLEFRAPYTTEVLWRGKKLTEHRGELTDRWNEEYFRTDGDRLYITVLPNGALEFRTMEKAATKLTR
jgi:peptidoglycan/xylan/chitin deacetylase (PgdA/CDA1 family)